MLTTSGLWFNDHNGDDFFRPATDLSAKYAEIAVLATASRPRHRAVWPSFEAERAEYQARQYGIYPAPGRHVAAEERAA